MKTVLVVNEPFGPYQRGDVIEDPKTVEAVLASENAPHVVRSTAPEPPKAAKK